MSNRPPDLAPHRHGRALAQDLAQLRLLDRRSALCLLGVAGGAIVAGVPEGAALGASGSCPAYAVETDGPYPADGTNRAPGATSNVLTIEAFRRRDIRASLVSSDTVAPGVRVELTLTLADAAGGCAPLEGRVIYLWHNDATGSYSLYDLPEESYLRGLQVTDAAGQVRFTSIFPGCYGGRYPHMHFQVFGSLEEASTGRQSLLTSQLAIPAAECASVYADAGTYGRSMANLQRSPLTRDFIFRDNPPAQMSAMTLAMRGSPAEGYAASATIGLTV